MNIKKGISLIVLVITIIVIIVLAATIIISLTNNNVIDNTNKAVEDTELANVRVMAQTAWSDAYTAGNRTQEALETAVRNALYANKFDFNKYTVTVTDKGATVEKSGEATPTPPVVSGGWTLEKTKTGSKVTSVKVKKGSQSIDVGTVVNYTAPAAKEYSGTWKILGVDEQGRIKLMSTESIGSKNLNGKTGFKTAISELNTMCEGYADGLKAESSRSIKVEDVDELTAFDKTTFGTNAINQYGNVVTYSWNGTDYPSYSGTNEEAGNLSNAHASGFTYYDEVTKEFVTKPKGTSGEITSLISNYYNYTGSTHLDSTTEAYKMIFKDPAGTNNTPAYWLASSFVNTGVYSAYFGARYVNSGNVAYINLVGSHNYLNGSAYGCRVVVTLKQGISLVINGDTGTYNIV